MSRTVDRAPLIRGPQSLAEVVERLVAVPLREAPRGWVVGLGLASALVAVLATSLMWLLIWGVGVWGIMIPVAWGFAITNFVWWIGIGHAGTLISAILLLLRQEWRTSINRFAEAMTLFAVANAGLFPLLHLGRIWKFYYLLPYPSSLELWPQWRSPLTWDVIAVLTYGLVSLMFWYMGLVPDLAAMRDWAKKRWVRVTAGVFALGWRGDARHWQRHQMTYLLLAGLATPLVVSVHSIVSLDFSTGIVPGWHSTVFPPYFVAGAIFSGFAMVLTLTVPLRAAYNLHDYVTLRHFDVMGKITLASALVVDYGYLMEFFVGWYSGDRFHIYMLVNRTVGDYWPAFALMMLGNVLAPQLLWFKKVRTRPVLLFWLSLLFNVGMWVERYVIVVQSLHRDWMPSAWGFFRGTLWDWALFVGTLGLFAFLFLLFIRLVPMVSSYEVRELLHDKGLVAPSEDAGEREPGPSGIDEASLHGVIAEYEGPEELLEAIRRARAGGYRRLKAYTPWPVEGVAEALGLKRTRIAPLMLLSGFAGTGAAYLMMWYSTVVDYPWNVGGRPLHSWPSYVPITFEVGVLAASLAGFLGLCLLSRLPQPYHPAFNAPGFERASVDRFFLCIEADDPSFERAAATAALHATSPLRVSEVPR